MTTNTYSTEAQLLQNTPKQLPLAVTRLKRFRNRIVLAGQLSGDTVTFLPLPVGAIFAFGIMNGPTLGSTTIAIADGTNTYLAATTFTSAVATIFGATGPENADPSAAPTQVQYTPVLTWGSATAPSSGTLTIDLYVSTQD
jgi:hypothetical protein